MINSHTILYNQNNYKISKCFNKMLRILSRIFYVINQEIFCSSKIKVILALTLLTNFLKIYINNAIDVYYEILQPSVSHDVPCL